MKIVILDGYTANPGDLSWDAFSRFGDVTVYDRTSYSECDAELIISRAKDADAVFTNKTPLNRAIIDALPKLKYIGILATGYNVVDINRAKERGIPVCNVPGYSSPGVVQHTFALLFDACNNVGLYKNSVLSGEWQNCADFCYFKSPIIELFGKNFGVIGFGSIGRSVAKVAQAFGMNVLVYTRHPDRSFESDSLKFVSLDELYSISDIISLHCPLNDDSREMINKKSIAKMKTGAILINTARGPILNEQDVADALNCEKLAYVCADVVSSEPIFENNPLLKAKNIILTPHVAWASKESRERLLDISADNLHAFVSGCPKNVVNP